ncbi:MAG: hypothetical protein HC899_32455 [Leptolyngbyaceae cyanobacterium SM1_4_3]|nr:hypothetical protein [Leptolyngbyaceae cyanobacterium SM1_4_3]NJN89183.1 hypothetical protein [Leptolyngbyaceae cyanobacterium SL_5_14]
MVALATLDPIANIKPIGAIASRWLNLNKLVMASLMRSFKGKVDLIYIDPPFDVGADFSMSVAIFLNTIKIPMEAFSYGTSS